MATNSQAGDVAANGRPQRISRDSPSETQVATTTQETPYGTLRQLANIPRPATPLRRASSAGPPSQRSTRQTPGAGQRPFGSARRILVITPHGRAAQRNLEARRAGLTPGKDRRRSGRQQKETPRDTLRALSRILAPKSQPIIPSPQDSRLAKINYRLAEEEEDDEPIERPRLSLPFVDEDDEDDSLLLPPRSAGLEDDNFTTQSVEYGRRAVSEQPLSRIARASFGSVRLSDQFGDLNGERGTYDSSIIAGQASDDDELPRDSSELLVDNTGTLRDLGLESGRLSLASRRTSDLRQPVLGDDTDTFIFTVPPRDVSALQEPDQAGQSPLTVEDEVSYQIINESLEGAADNVVEDIELEGIALSSSPHPPDVDVSFQERIIEEAANLGIGSKISRTKKAMISKHGIQYPSLPPGLVRKLATSYARTGGNGKARISKDTLDAIMQASSWFFEQVSDDLAAYAQHAGRKTIDESDVVTLMARQRQTNSTTTLFSLAQKHLPRELLQDLRMVPPSKLNKGQQLHRVDETDE